MERYKGSDKGGVSSYEIFKDSIDLTFKEGRTYKYNYSKPGKDHVEKMKKLANDGNGLTTYVNKYVRDNYSGLRDN